MPYEMECTSLRRAGVTVGAVARAARVQRVGVRRQGVRDEGAGLHAFLARAACDLDACPDAGAVGRARGVIDRFVALSRDIETRKDDAAVIDRAADGYLRAGWVAVQAWMCCRLLRIGSAVAAPARHRLHAQ